MDFNFQFDAPKHYQFLYQRSQSEHLEPQRESIHDNWFSEQAEKQSKKQSRPNVSDGLESQKVESAEYPSLESPSRNLCLHSVPEVSNEEQTLSYTSVRRLMHRGENSVQKNKQCNNKASSPQKLEIENQQKEHNTPNQESFIQESQSQKLSILPNQNPLKVNEIYKSQTASQQLVNANQHPIKRTQIYSSSKNKRSSCQQNILETDINIKEIEKQIGKRSVSSKKKSRQIERSHSLPVVLPSRQPKKVQDRKKKPGNVKSRNLNNKKALTKKPRSRSQSVSRHTSRNKKTNVSNPHASKSYRPPPCSLPARTQREWEKKHQKKWYDVETEDEMEEALASMKKYQSQAQPRPQTTKKQTKPKLTRKPKVTGQNSKTNVFKQK